MARNVIVYVIIHQPRRVRLPAQPISKNASVEEIERCLFDEELNQYYFKKVALYSYYPAAELFEGLLKQGFKLSLGISHSFLKQAAQYDPSLLRKFQDLVKHPNLELICVEPYHSFIFYLDLTLFGKRMQWARENLKKLFGKKPDVTDTTEMFMNNEVYYLLDELNFKAALMEGNSWVLGWRSPTYLYDQGRNLALLMRHKQLSDDLGYRFSDRSWNGYPLYASTYAKWIRDVPGDFVLLAWDFETFGEHHSRDTGIFEFMRWLPAELHRQGVQFLTASQALDKFQKNRYEITLPAFPSSWAGSGGMEFFLGNSAQQAVFQLMHHAYNMAKLSRDPALIDLALWLAQSDNLHLIQWFGRTGQEAEVSAYFTPHKWWQLGSEGIVRELQQVYKNFIQAIARRLAKLQ